MPGGYRLDILSESRPNPNAKNEILVFSSPTGNASENSLDNVSGISAVNGLPRLAIPTIGYHNIGTDDSSDIIMGENTPIEVVRYVIHS